MNIKRSIAALVLAPAAIMAVVSCGSKDSPEKVAATLEGHSVEYTDEDTGAEMALKLDYHGCVMTRYDKDGYDYSYELPSLCFVHSGQDPTVFEVYSRDELVENDFSFDGLNWLFLVKNQDPEYRAIKIPDLPWMRVSDTEYTEIDMDGEWKELTDEQDNIVGRYVDKMYKYSKTLTDEAIYQQLVDNLR